MPVSRVSSAPNPFETRRQVGSCRPLPRPPHPPLEPRRFSPFHRPTEVRPFQAVGRRGQSSPSPDPRQIVSAYQAGQRSVDRDAAAEPCLLRYLPYRFFLKISPNDIPGFLAHPDFSRLCRLLNTGCRVGRITNRCVIHRRSSPIEPTTTGPELSPIRI